MLGAGKVGRAQSMDGFREYPTEFDLPEADEVAQPYDVAAAIGTDERRLHVRAYNHWVSLLRGREFPSIEDLEPDDVEDLATHSVLLDFTCGHDDPAIPYVGTAIRDECCLDDDIRTIGDVPSRSLLSRLTDHYLQIIANRSPVGFEAEFENPGGESICYRGILMPFSSDGDAIDFIYGVINWKHAAAPAELETADSEEPQVSPVEHAPLEDEPVAEDDPLALVVPFAEISPPALNDVPSVELEDFAAAPPREPFSLEIEADDDDALPAVAHDPDVGLADRLWAARETAETVKAGEGRTPAAPHRAPSLAYYLAGPARPNPHGYAPAPRETSRQAAGPGPVAPVGQA